VGLSLHNEKAAALAATGEEIVWKGRTLHALVSDNPLSQDLGLGGFAWLVEKTPGSRFPPPKKERARSALTVFSSLFRKQLRLFNETSGVNLA
jgi:hypothetical protein